MSPLMKELPWSVTAERYAKSTFGMLKDILM